MKRLIQFLVVLALLPFMALGAVFELAAFSFSCGRDAGFNLLDAAFKKGAAQ